MLWRVPAALLLHQRARMERLMKELLLEKQKLDHLKADVNNMEYDALQRRFRRVNSTSLIPRVRTELYVSHACQSSRTVSGCESCSDSTAHH